MNVGKRYMVVLEMEDEEMVSLQQYRLCWLFCFHQLCYLCRLCGNPFLPHVWNKESPSRAKSRLDAIGIDAS